MDVRLCKGCNKMFQYVAGPTLCPRCRKKEEEMFEKVKDYLRENPGDTMSQVSEETEVPVSTIEKFLRQGRLEVSPSSPISLKCEICGTSIVTGRFCNKCKRELAGDFDDAKASMLPKETAPADDSKARMRYLQGKNIR